MRFLISADAQELGIVNPVAAVISNLTIVEPSPESLVDEGNRALEHARASLNTRLNQQEVVGFRQLFANLGYTDLEPAGERLVRSFLARGFKPINSLVDAYNITAIEGVCGLGMHDIADNVGTIRVFRAAGTETIVPMFKNKSKTIPKGDLMYTLNSCPLAWLGLKDVDADDFKISSETRVALLVALGNANTSSSYNESIITACFERVRSVSPLATMSLFETALER